MGREKSYLALRPEERVDLTQTMEEVINELERIIELCGRKKYNNEDRTSIILKK